MALFTFGLIFFQGNHSSYSQALRGPFVYALGRRSRNEPSLRRLKRLASRRKLFLITANCVKVGEVIADLYPHLHVQPVLQALRRFGGLTNWGPR